MNKLICSLIVAIGFGSLPAVNAAESSPVTAGHSTTQRVLTRKHHRHHKPVVHHRHHRHHHHSKGKK